MTIELLLIAAQYLESLQNTSNSGQYTDIIISVNWPLKVKVIYPSKLIRELIRMSLAVTQLILCC